MSKYIAWCLVHDVLRLISVTLGKCICLVCLLVISASCSRNTSDTIVLASYGKAAKEQYIDLFEEALDSAPKAKANAALLKLRLAELVQGPEAVGLYQDCLAANAYSSAGYYGLVVESPFLSSNLTEILHSWIQKDPTNALPYYLVAQKEMRNENVNRGIEFIRRGNEAGSSRFLPVYYVVSQSNGISLQREEMRKAENEFIARTGGIRSKLLDLARRSANEMLSGDEAETIRSLNDVVLCADSIACSEPLSAIHFAVGCEMARITISEVLKTKQDLSAPMQQHLNRLLDERKRLSKRLNLLILDGQKTGVDEAAEVEKACKRLRSLGLIITNEIQHAGAPR